MAAFDCAEKSRIGDGVEIVAAAGKVAAPDPPVRRVGAGDENAVAGIGGHRTAPGRSTVRRVRA